MTSDWERWVDFQRAVLNLRRNGWTYKRIGQRVGVTESTVSKWATGRNDPGFYPGNRLIDLHLDMCPDKHQELI